MTPTSRLRQRWTAWLPATLTSQVLVAVSVTLLLSLGLSAAWMATEQLHVAHHTLGRQAAAMARTIAASSEDNLIRENLDLTEQLLERAMESPDVLSAWIIDASGRSLSHIERDDAGHPQVRFEPGHTRVELPKTPDAAIVDGLGAVPARIVAWQPIIAGRLLGWVRLDYGIDQWVAARHRILRTGVASALLSCLLGALLLTALLRAPMRALREASAFAQELEQRSEQRLPSLSGPSEIASLYTALNTAAERLGRHKAQIEADFFHLMSQEVALTDSNNQLGTLFALSPDGIASIDAANRIALANEALTRMVGLGREQLEGRPAEILDAHLKRVCVDAGGFDGLAALFDTPGASAPRARRITIDATGRRVLEIVGVVATSAAVRKLLYVRDVTRDTEVEQMKSDFLSTAAHELRTPMSSIFGFTELMMNREYPPERQRSMQAKVHRQCRAMMGILDELLDLARIEARAGKDFELATIDLRDLVDAAVQDYQPPARRTDIAWMRPPTQASWVRIDRNKMMQVMLNLISNAYKYSPAGGEVSIALVHAASTPHGTRHGIAIRDMGIGMTPAQAERIFERFYRVDKSGAIPGTGLGMSITREILTLLGGEIEVDSVHGAGTTMRVWLPPVATTVDARHEEVSAA